MSILSAAAGHKTAIVPNHVIWRYSSGVWSVFVKASAAYASPSASVAKSINPSTTYVSPGRSPRLSAHKSGSRNQPFGSPSPPPA